jgi:hypothetical protein
MIRSGSVMIGLSTRCTLHIVIKMGEWQEFQPDLVNPGFTCTILQFFTVFIGEVS